MMKLAGSRRRLRIEHRQDNFNPMEGVANMADAMLVFAVGILLALILSWNVDVSEDGAISAGKDTKYELENVENGQTQEINTEENMEELGTVYRDPQTGKYYVVEK